jgi:hypothetical protein
MRAVFPIAFAALTFMAATSASAAPIGCDAFKAEFQKAVGDLKFDFVRPVIVSRGIVSNDDVFDLVSQTKVDGTLYCRNDRFRRFEARISVPADNGLLDRFQRVEKAGIEVALKWQPPRADQALRTMDQEADEYLRASIQRGDVYYSGKTEYHEGGADLGMIWTPHDRSLIIVGD